MYKVLTLVIAIFFAGTVHGQQRPRLGIVPDYTAKDAVVIQEITMGGAAAKAGMKIGDQITDIAGKPVKGLEDYLTAMKDLKVGDTVEVVYKRDGKETKVKVELK